MYISAMESRPYNYRKFTYVSDVVDPVPVDSVLMEFTLNEARTRARIQTYRSVFRIGLAVYDHPIKQIVFDRRERLYIGHGDGAGQGAFGGGGQNVDALGKILRIDPLPRQSGPYPRRSYRIPPDNPFVGQPGSLPEVYASGFRNPHHLCFGGGKDLFVAETGRSNVEEINIVRGGENFGWSEREGPFRYIGFAWKGGVKPLPADDEKFNYTYSAAAWGHVGVGEERTEGQAIGGSCPVTNASPMRGMYLYADFPISGKLFYSNMSDLLGAVTRGPPAALTRAPTYRPNICWHGRDGVVRRAETLKEVIVKEDGLLPDARADIRFGRGPRGVLYWSSKTTGKIYIFLTSSANGPTAKC